MIRSFPSRSRSHRGTCRGLGPRGSGRRGFGRTEILVGIAIAALLALVAVPWGLHQAKKSRRAEVPLLVDAIRMAELQYHSAFREYVPAEAAPRPPHAVDPTPVPWVPSAGFRELSWAPEQAEVRGSYSVQVDGGGFTVTGACDVDGDGNRAVYTATAEHEARRVSESNVY